MYTILTGQDKIVAAFSTLHHHSHKTPPYEVFIIASLPPEEMSYAEALGGHTHLSSGRERAGSRGEGGPYHEKISFFSGIPVVECIKGVLHLYKPQ